MARYNNASVCPRWCPSDSIPVQTDVSYGEGRSHENIITYHDDENRNQVYLILIPAAELVNTLHGC
jgi:hypothetical protein